ncbi:MAG TPA: DNA-3-methyladenine glycosylase 2 family protein [Actinomycetota bacterium]
MSTRLIPLHPPVDLVETLQPLWRGRADPTMRIRRDEIVRASRTPEGPATVRLLPREGSVLVEAWGQGAGWMLEHAPGWCGALDPDGFDPPRGVVRDAWRRHQGLRIPRTGLVTEALIPIVLEQKVTGMEARRAYARMVRALGEPAPGPFGLTLPPDPGRMAELPYFAFHPFGVERKRAEVLRALCSKADRLDAAASLPIEDAKGAIGALRGIGPWSVAEVARIALGDADAVSVGDVHVPHVVAWALAREPRGTDERMLELLEPYRPHRGRVQLLLEASGVRAPAFGPRMEPRSIDRI